MVLTYRKDLAWEHPEMLTDNKDDNVNTNRKTPGFSGVFYYPAENI